MVNGLRISRRAERSRRSCADHAGRLHALVRRGHTTKAARASAVAAPTKAIKSRHLLPKMKYAAGSNSSELLPFHEA